MSFAAGGGYTVGIHAPQTGGAPMRIGVTEIQVEDNLLNLHED
jgi:hypothetical protein